MTIQTLRINLSSKKIIWVKSDKSTNGRFIPDVKNKVNHTLVYVPSTGYLHIDNGISEMKKAKITDKQYQNLFKEYGYK